MNQLESLIRYFPTGTAEGDIDILDRVFIYASEFSQVIAPPSRSPHLLIGAKGSGKTAVLSFSRRLLDQQKVPNVLLTPFDIESTELDGENSTGDMTRAFYTKLVDAIVTKLTHQNSGLLDGDYATIYQYAVNQNLRSPDGISKSLRFLGEIARPLSGVDLNAAFPHLTSTTRADVQEAMARVIGRISFYLFVDDTDQVARPGVSGHLNRVWSLLLAVRRLCQDVGDLRAVVSLRTEVWQRMQRDDTGQRDQTDHFRQLIVNMHTDREHVGKIVDRRLALAAADVSSPVDGFQQFFDGAGARPPTSRSTRTWRDLILVRTRDRPRDAIQLVNELARLSIREGNERVTESVFQSVMPDFSKSIAKQFSEEVRLEFPEALEYLSSLAEVNYTAGSFTMSAEDVRLHFERMLTRFGGTLDGVPLTQNADGPLRVWRFLYQAGVLNARVSDGSQRQGFSHLNPMKDPFLVTRARWNELQALLWEVNAVYRDFLIARQQELSLRSGLPVKPKRRRR
jgi:hypothetical protein